MKEWLLIIWGIIKVIINWKSLSQIEERVKELEHEIKPIEKNYEKYRKLASEAAGGDRNDQLDYYDRMSRMFKSELTAAFAKFGESVFNAYWYKN